MTRPVYLDYNATLGGVELVPGKSRVRRRSAVCGLMTTDDDTARAASGLIAAWRRLVAQ